ncbi:MAG: cytoplasmic protein [Tissierellia bacterium]|nr:cytoplasmic protein [Tissierellia bacterium]
MRKIVFFAFQGEPMCFTHLLFNAVDLHKKGHDVKIVIEGKATALIEKNIESNNPHFMEAKELGLIDSVCKACANQMGALDYIKNNTDLVLNGDLVGHPPMEPYVREGYEIITL